MCQAAPASLFCIVFPWRGNLHLHPCGLMIVIDWWSTERSHSCCVFVELRRRTGRSRKSYCHKGTKVEVVQLASSCIVDDESVLFLLNLCEPTLFDGCVRARCRSEYILCMFTGSDKYTGRLRKLA